MVIFEDCKLFRDVAHTRSLSRAAAMNGISQSAATQHIQELEKKLRVQLLDRSTRPLGLTAGGKLYAELCRDVLRCEENFLAALDEIKAGGRGHRARSASHPTQSGCRRCPGSPGRVFPRLPERIQLRVEFLRPDKVYQAVLEDQARPWASSTTRKSTTPNLP